MAAASAVSTDPMLAVLIALGVIVVAARLGGMLVERCGQPPVIGELAAGLLLGPTVLGMLPGDLDHVLFPDSVRPVLSALAQIGLAIFLFLIGSELDVSTARRRRRAVASISAASFGLPFALGVVAAIALYGVYGAHAPGSAGVVPFAIFLGTALSITAVPVLARQLERAGLMNTEFGTLALTCAVVQDVAAWGALALALGLAGGSGVADGVLACVFAVVLAVGLLGVVRPVLRRVIERVAASPSSGPAILVIAVAGTAAAGALSAAAGLHLAFGAFLFGVAFPRDALVQEHLRQSLTPVTGAVLLPIFFFLPGLQVNLRTLEAGDLGVLALILAIACVGKIVGTTVAATGAGMRWREASALGVLMNGRGMVELIVLNIGLAVGILDTGLYAVMVVVTIVTTTMAAPLVRMLLRPRPARAVRRRHGAPEHATQHAG